VAGTRGCFIVLEGPEGAGKSTQLPRLARRLTAAGHDLAMTREPGGTPHGERIRAVLLDPAGEALDPVAEALLFAAARAELVRRVIGPALEAGRVVLSDRFTASTLAYQGYGRGLALPALEAVNALATGGCTPDAVLLLDLPADLGLARRRGAGGLDRIDREALAFHERVAAGYRALAAADPARWRVIDAAAEPDAVADALFIAAHGVLAERVRAASTPWRAGDAAHRRA